MDQRTIGESDVEAWHLVLQSVPFDKARTAVAEHYRETERRIMPADVARRCQPVRWPVYGQPPVRPDQPEINARGRLLCMAVLAGRRGPLVDGMREAIDEGS